MANVKILKCGSAWLMEDKTISQEQLSGYPESETKGKAGRTHSTLNCRMDSGNWVRIGNVGDGRAEGKAVLGKR